MTWVAVAVGGGAALQAGGSIWSGMMSRDAAKEAAATMSDASMRAEAGLTSRQNQALALLAPFLNPGARAGDTLSMFTVSPQERARQEALQLTDLQSEIKRLSVPTDWNSFPILTGKRASERRQSLWTETEHKRMDALRDAQSKLQNFQARQQVAAQYPDDSNAIDASPLYQFQLDQGTKAINRQLASKGLSGSGQGVKLLGDFIRGLGAEESDRQYGRLFNLFGTGAGAASQSSNLLAAFAPQIAQTQLQAGQAQSQGILGAGEATANMIAGTTNAVTSGMGNYLQYDLFKSLINRNAGPSYRASAPGYPANDVMVG